MYRKTLLAICLLLLVGCEDREKARKFLREMADAGFVYQQCDTRYGTFYRWVKKEDINLPCTAR